MSDREVAVSAVLEDRFSKPIRELEGKLAGVVKKAETLAARVSPLFTKIAALVGTISAAAVAGKALEAARQEVESQQKLLAALQGRELALRRISEANGKIAAQTRFQRDELDEQAAILVRLGVATEKIPDTLRAAVGVAEALDLSLDRVVRNLGTALNTGRAGELGERIPELKALEEQGRLSADALALLTQRFGDAGEAAANTPFGRGAQLVEDLNDALVPLGTKLQEIKVAFLEALLPIVQRLAEAVETPAFAAFVEILKRAAPAILAAASAAGLLLSALAGIQGLIVFLPAIKAVVAGFATLDAAIASFATAAAVGPAAPFVIVGLAIAALTTIILGLLGVLDDAIDAFGTLAGIAASSARSFGELVSKVFEGRLGFEDLADVISTRLAQAAVIAKGVFFDPLIALATALFETFTGFFDAARLLAIRNVVLVGDAIQDVILGALRAVAGAIDAVLDGLDLALSRIDKRLGTSLAFGGGKLASLVPEDPLGLDTALAGLDRLIAAAAEKTVDAFPKAFREIVSGFQETFLTVDRMGSELADRLTNSEDRRLRAKAAQIEKEIALEIAKQERIVAAASAADREIRRLESFEQTLAATPNLVDIDPAEIDRLLGSIDRDAQDQVRALLTRELEDQLRREQITIEEFLALRRRIQAGLLEDEVASKRGRLDMLERERRALVLQLEDVEALAAAELARATALEGQDGAGESLKATNERRLELAKQQTELEGQITDRTKAQLEIQRKLRDVQLQLVASEQEQRELRVQFAEASLQEFQTESARVGKGIELTAEAVQAGSLSIDRAVEEVDLAVAALAQTSGEARSELERLLAGGQGSPALAQALERLLADLDRLERERVVELRLAIAKSSVQVAVETASEALQAALKRTSDAAELGLLSPSQIVADTESATERLETQVNSTALALRALLATETDPAVVRQLEALVIQLERVKKLADDAPTQAADLLRQRADAAAQAFERAFAVVDDRVRRGDLAAADGARQQAEAFLVFEEAIRRTIDAFDELILKNPELAAQLGLLRGQIVLLQTEIGEGFGESQEGFTKGLREGIQATVNDLSDLEAVGHRVGQAVTNDLFDGLVDVFVRGRKSFGEFLRDFLAGIALMIAKALFFRAISGAIGLGPTGANEGGSAAFFNPFASFPPGTPTLAFAGGGSVPGPRVHRDIVNARLTPGEWVIPEEPTSHYGAVGMNVIMKKLIPREVLLAYAGSSGLSQIADVKRSFATGGEVLGDARGSTGSGAPTPAYIVAGEEALEKLLGGGQSAMFRWMRRNQAQARAELGIV